MIPEIHFEMSHGTLGGKYTTVEGVMMDMYNQLASVHQFQAGDSAFDCLLSLLVLTVFF